METPEFKFLITKETRDECQRLEMDPKIFLPTKSEPFAAGFDVRCAVPGGIEIAPNCFAKINLGIKSLIPSGWYLRINPRSSTFTKLHLQSLYGIIDETFVGEHIIAVYYTPDACKLLHSSSKLKINFADRIGQFLPHKSRDMISLEIFEEEFEIGAKEKRKWRDPSGFGSSGIQ